MGGSWRSASPALRLRAACGWLLAEAVDLGGLAVPARVRPWQHLEAR